MTTKRKKQVAIGLLIATALITPTLLHYHQSVIAPQPLLFVGDFETGDLTGFYGAGNTPEIVSTGHPVRAGNHSMRAYLHRYESGCSYRTMVIAQPDDTGPPGQQAEFHFAIRNEYWIGFSTHIQSDLVSDPPELSDVVWQIHARPDPGEDWQQPTIALCVDTLEVDGDLVNYWRIWRLWDTRAMTPPGAGPEYKHWHEMMLPMDAADIGGWTDWVFHVIVDYTDSGLLQAWRNGELVLDVSGGNCFNDQIGPYPSFGVYKWSYDDPYEHNSEWRLLYFDEFRIGDANATYEDVAPPAEPTPTPTPTPTTVSPTPTPGGHWYDDCPPDPPTRTPWPVQPTLTPRPTYTPAPTPTCQPTIICPPNPSPTPRATATFYPTHTPYPPQPTTSGARRAAGTSQIPTRRQ